MSDGTDLHTRNAAKMFGVPESEVTREQRSEAKTTAFATHYGSQRGIVKTYEVIIAKVHEHLYPSFIHGHKGTTQDDKVRPHMIVTYGKDDLWVDPRHIETLQPI